jgi:hypothetical protein
MINNFQLAVAIWLKKGKGRILRKQCKKSSTDVEVLAMPNHRYIEERKNETDIMQKEESKVFNAQLKAQAWPVGDRGLNQALPEYCP